MTGLLIAGRIVVVPGLTVIAPASHCQSARPQWGIVSKFVDLTGHQFGRLTAVSRVVNQGPRTQWLCRCDCGTSKVIAAIHLTGGRTRSCGCYRRETGSALHRKHGHAGKDSSQRTRTYESWKGIIKRCTNPRANAYQAYGGRGIAVCERWRNSFESFLTDMGECPSNMSIDRIDVNGNYEPENCRWATQAEQCQNKRCSKLTAIRALEVMGRYEHGESVSSIALRLGVGRHIVSDVVNGRSWGNIVRQ